jgi:Na+-driven multidrug efflux pump
MVGVPVAFISYFCTDLGLVGIWMASFAGNAVTLVLALYFVSRSNWAKIVADSEERIVEIREEPLEPNHTLKDGVVV